MTKVKIKKLHPDAIIPTYGTDGAACFDLYALQVDGLSIIGNVINDDSPVICRTGLSFEIPHGYAMMIYSRSGHGFKQDIRLANCVGVIDSDYRGEVMVKLTCDLYKELPDVIKPGDRVAQAMIVPVDRVEFETVDELSGTDRGAGGFGSTGA